MPFQSGGDERTEAATPKKRQEARRKGQVAKSRELSTVAVLLGSLLFFRFMGFRMTEQIGEFMSSVFSNSWTTELNQESIRSFWLWTLSNMGVILLPVMAVSIVAGLASNVMQVGFLLTPEPLMPKPNRVDPVRGLKRILSWQSIIELLKSVLKIAVIGFIAFTTIKKEYGVLFHLYDMEIISIASYLARVSMGIFMRAALGIFAIAAMDYAFQRWQYERNLKMTKQEVKDELKQREGDPLIKSRIKSIQMKMARQRMMASVPDADVVITNPTHLAIALQYEHGLMDAPKVVAKGAGHVARRIVSIAEEEGVPVVEDKPLAKSLYALVEVGRFIPAQLYRAVAEMLAYVYQLKTKA
jgi:flagellar biosynthetic protein FlhB